MVGSPALVSQRDVEHPNGGGLLIDILPPGLGNANVSAEDKWSHVPLPGFGFGLLQIERTALSAMVTRFQPLN